MVVREQLKNNSDTLIRKSVEMTRSPLKLVKLKNGLDLRQQRFFNLTK